MWLFTKYGFYSVVCARQGDGRHGEPADPNRLMIRARVRQHLEALKDRFPHLLNACEIKEFAGTDYAFRVFLDKAAWSRLLVKLNEEMDYDNFKSEVAHFQGRNSYEHSLHEVWSVMNTLQK
jgi:hypothetical protein